MCVSAEFTGSAPLSLMIRLIFCHHERGCHSERSEYSLLICFAMPSKTKSCRQIRANGHYLDDGYPILERLLMGLADAERVRAALAGDRSAFGDLYDRHARWVRAVLYDVIHDLPQAQDLAQEVFLRAY